MFDVTTLLLLVGAATGAPVTTVEGAPLITCGFGTSVIGGTAVVHAVPTTVWVGPLVVVYDVVGAPVPTVVTILL